MTEAQFQTAFSKWAKSNVRECAAFELKITDTNSLPFSALKDHQIANLLSAKHRTLVYKIADVGYDQKPFDCFVLSGSAAYLVVMFYTRGEKEFYIIDIEEFERYKETSTRKSLTRDDARSLATRIGILK